MFIGWATPRMWPCTPKIIETVVNFDERGLGSQNWHQKRQKIDVYIPFKGHFYQFQSKKKLLTKSESLNIFCNLREL